VVTFIIKRLLLLIPTVIGVVSIAFLVMRLIPGDAAQFILGDYATKETLAQLREQLGLMKPIHVQYVRFLSRALVGDFGRSLVTQRPAFDEALAVFPYTIQLATAGTLLSMLIGVPIGILSALSRNTPVDFFAMTFALVGVSMPVFWLGLLLLLIFSLYLGWTPTVGAGQEGNVFNQLHHLALPALTLAISIAAMVTRMTRSTMLEVVSQDYIRTALAKGLREPWVIMKHALRNASLPIVTVVGINFGVQLGGTVLIETIFARPGLGNILISSIYQRDYPVVQATVVLFASSFILVNLLVDLLYVILDPRLKG
jgi:peptide/nickel transport system permease protein